MTRPRNVYIVVCRDLHAAAGLFTTAQTAIDTAKRMNELSKQCTFVPVPIELGDNVEYIGFNVPDTIEGIEDIGKGGYL